MTEHVMGIRIYFSHSNNFYSFLNISFFICTSWKISKIVLEAWCKAHNATMGALKFTKKPKSETAVKPRRPAERERAEFGPTPKACPGG
jgi:hypothetical protein